MVSVQDLTRISVREIDRLRRQYQKLLFMTIAHEKTGPLRNIVMLAESIMKKTYPQINAQTNEKREASINEIKILWSSVKTI